MDSQPQPFNTPDPNQAILMQNKFILAARARRGTDWFFWIAGLSLINSVTSLLNLNFSFIAGLATTQLVDGFASIFAKDLTGNGKLILFVIAFCVDLGIAGLFVLAGFLARKRYSWIIIVGMALYALDGLVFLLFQEWIPFLFHGWALWSLWNGLQAVRKLNALEKTQQ